VGYLIHSSSPLISTPPHPLYPLLLTPYPHSPLPLATPPHLHSPLALIPPPPELPFLDSSPFCSFGVSIG
jgi:hypothetical protein